MKNWVCDDLIIVEAPQVVCSVPRAVRTRAVAAPVALPLGDGGYRL